jgi:hypothetical protein
MDGQDEMRELERALRHLRPDKRVKFQLCCARCGEWIKTMYEHGGEGLCRVCYDAVLGEQRAPGDSGSDEGEGGAE